MRRPRFFHDCQRCIYLGRYLGDVHGAHIPADLYYCPGEPTVLARYSDEPSDYSSGIPFWKVARHIRVAIHRAALRRLIRSTDKVVQYHSGLVKMLQQLEEQLE